MIYLDTNIFVYSVLDNEKKGKSCKEIIKKIVYKEIEGCTSLLTWDEMFYTLKKHAPTEEVLEQSKEFLNLPNMTFLNVNYEIIKKAEEICKTYNLKPRDAIHAATAILNKCSVILSDDPDFDKLKEIKRKKI